MSELARNAGYGQNERLKSALLQHRALSLDGLSERLFGLLFSGLVYPQIWEDPAIDIEAMELAPGHRLVTIGSGGCNMLAYLACRPERIDVVDLNPHHIALNRLKLAAFRHMPSHADVVRFLGGDNMGSNREAYQLFLEPRLDAQTRDYWNGRDLTARRRIDVFNRNIYRTGLLGRFILLGHIVARLHGLDPRDFVKCGSMREQRQFFDTRIAPLFDRPLIRWITSRKASLYGLGIPPQQFDELASVSDDNSLAPVLRQRLEKLACHFPLKDNYFAWQAFARRYPSKYEGRMPDYLLGENYAAIRDNAERVDVHHASFTELLASKSAASVDRFVLLDAQDWMNDDQLNALWTEISRTATPGARVIFRTAAEASVVEGKVSQNLLDLWHYEHERSSALGMRDRSAIYGAFHIYRKKP
ncbi:S-adenosylmethionine-diacylglycerol 3-amino-3-carboxypropyl transferase [Rhizobium subbaraonis]|uniref:S-adenosylmethionine-diacylglycerol 3-amino-3-carboxypropyl transferase n=1 Tax=Rhizobium subbaraonis TaxID=908946 RepID=A0A285UEH2_9HYPH|nr:DUF3419 family protein [Rhizobium subbaraonis]SOC40325.1 S-adenosylmethionine-diacylglycerol 3-amino-3-carboxypropyl transferase [Rhizobium subbaraonis]